MPALLAPPIRVRTAPQLDPPYDDEAGPISLPIAAPPPVVPQTPLPLDWSGLTPQRMSPTAAAVPAAVPAPQRMSPTAAAVPAAVPATAPVMVPAVTAPASPAGTVGARPTSPGGDPAGPIARAGDPAASTSRAGSPARGATMHFLSLCLEVLNGYRPAAHLRPLTAPAEFQGIAAQLSHALTRLSAPASRAPVQFGRRMGDPATAATYLRAPSGVRTRPVAGTPRAGRSGAAHPMARIRLLNLRVCEPRPGVAEAAAVLGDGGRSWALMLRLERRPAGWQCTLAHVI